MKILVAIDGSAYSRRLLDYLAAHREEWLSQSQRYTVLHVVPAVPAGPASVLDRRLLDDYYAEESAKVLQPAREFFAGHQIEAEFLGKVGSPANVIATMAQTGPFDLLMLGSHGHGALANLVMGSVATKVLANCNTPVLLLR
jgi:nucleotide-binding universal stress UspA family protein